MNKEEIKETIHSHLDQSFDKVTITDDNLAMPNHIIIKCEKNGKNYNKAYTEGELDDYLTKHKQPFLENLKWEMLEVVG